MGLTCSGQTRREGEASARPDINKLNELQTRDRYRDRNHAQASAHHGQLAAIIELRVNETPTRWLGSARVHDNHHESTCDAGPMDGRGGQHHRRRRRVGRLRELSRSAIDRLVSE
ncbi:MAG: hypothetical protein ACOC0P_00625, partial [Planctomycetota bacterium]